MGAIYAATSDIELLWRPLSDEEATLADALLSYASNILRARVPSVDKRLADGTLDPDLVRDTVAQMLIRVLRNPDGVTQTSETIGPFSTSKSIDAKVAAGYLYVTDEELAVLGGAPTGRQVGGSARLGVGGMAFPPW